MEQKTKPLDNFYLGKRKIPIELSIWNKKSIERVVKKQGKLLIPHPSYYDEFGNLQHLPYAAKEFEYAKQYRERLKT